MAKKAEINEHKGVWVFIEQSEGAMTKVTLAIELLGKGRELADTLGVALTAVLLGEAVGTLADELILYGADRVIVADHPMLKEYQPELY